MGIFMKLLSQDIGFLLGTLKGRYFLFQLILSPKGAADPHIILTGTIYIGAIKEGISYTPSRPLRSSSPPLSALKPSKTNVANADRMRPLTC